MQRIFALFHAFVFLLLAAVPSVSADHVYHVESSDGTELRRVKGNEAVVMGRVISSRMADGQLWLTLDGGHLSIAIAIAKQQDWNGKLIEVSGNVEEAAGAKEGDPKLKIFLRTAEKIRLIAETPEGAASKLIVREKPQNLDRFFHRPPGSAPVAGVLAAAPSIRKPQQWVRADGVKATILFDHWEWRQRLGPDLKTTEWVVAMRYWPNGSTLRWYYPEDLKLAAGEEDRLLLMLWKNYKEKEESLTNRAPRPAAPVEGDAMTATEPWLDRITHWGEAPLKDSSEGQRLPGPEDFGNLPELRKLTEVKLRRASPQGRQEGKLMLLDWAMTAEAAATKVPARIRWEDGLEETVPALDVFPLMVYARGGGGGGEITQAESGLIYMKDWTRSRQLREKVPGADLKIRAIRQFLKNWWDSPLISFRMADKEKQRKQLEDHQKQEEARRIAATVSPFEEKSRPSRSGHTLEFPGLPPKGFKELSNTRVDRSLLKPMEQEVGKQKIDDTVANMMAVMLWWDAAGVVTLPEKLGKRRREEMLLNLLERYLNGWSSYHQPEGFLKMMEGSYGIQLTSDSDYSPANLARLTTGHHAVILHFSVWDAREYRFPMEALVHTAMADGSVTFSTWGEIGTGRLKTVALHPTGKRPNNQPQQVRECYELELTGSAALMQYLQTKGYRLLLDDWKWEGITAVTPWAADPAAPPVKK